eukprot:4630823-Amphidinium_carterae.1
MATISSSTEVVRDGEGAWSGNPADLMTKFLDADTMYKLEVVGCTECSRTHVFLPAVQRRR